ncbi:ATPASE H+-TRANSPORTING V1 SUBUNIT E1A-RELATED [Salix purpurea]|uniref:ATPASE H+-TRANSPORTING V1 SUBUNIT E1A-RELATED n=2 Tax=Salix TaxID=40685 RepID=A0A9Q0WGT0_SALPP|nr:ATPASE H+-TRANSPORTING V1 SUBUNIT E1A-RELATED [Salix purpurea]
MIHGLREMLIFLFLAVFSKATGAKAYSRGVVIQEGAAYCLSWRLAVEANNVRAWRTVPSQCLRYVETYMLGGQYERDLDLIVGQILSYVNGIAPSSDGMDAWILDVDDTCISNVLYYRGKRYGCDPYDPAAFRAWALKGGCPAIPAVLALFSYLVQSGFKVFLVTGRDQETLGQVTLDNLHYEGFVGYKRLILRTAEFKGQSAVAYKSEIRRQIEEEGYRIWGNEQEGKMNDADVSKQIQQMARFIRQEAEEKANEISVSAEEEFNIEKLQILEAEKKRIRQEFVRKTKQVDIRRKIEYSMQLNASRIKALQAQDDIVNSMKESACKQLLRVSNNKKEYRKLLKDLIVQSLIRLKEPAVLLRCREVDRKIVESVLDDACRLYAAKAQVHAPDVTIDTTVYLPPPPKSPDSHEPFCSGGVVMASKDGKIVFENTLDARLDVAFRKKLPEIRKQLLGKVGA